MGLVEEELAEEVAVLAMEWALEEPEAVEWPAAGVGAAGAAMPAQEIWQAQLFPLPAGRGQGLALSLSKGEGFP